MERREIRDILIALGVLLGIRLAVLAIAPYSLGSTDLRSWAEVANHLVNGRNPYALTAKLNWPPFWMQILYVLGRLTVVTGADFGILVKLVLISVECVLTAVLYLVARRLLGVKRPLRIVVLAICVNPVAIFQVLQHCNFDVLIGLWVLLFFWSIARFAEGGEEQYWLLGALFLGMGIWAKTVPICLVPVALFGIRRVSRPVLVVGLFLILAPVSIAMSVIYVLTPDTVVEHVLQYRSAPGCFGISGLLHLVDQQGMARAMAKLFQIAYFGALVYTGYHFLHREAVGPRTLLGVILLLLVSIPVLGPGYAPQYVYWYLPLLALAYHCGTRRTRRLLVALHCVMVLTYIIEYALFHTHGLLVVYLVPTDTVKIAHLLSKVISTGGGQTLVRLPLFILYLLLMANIVAGLRSGSPRDLVEGPERLGG